MTETRKSKSSSTSKPAAKGKAAASKLESSGKRGPAVIAETTPFDEAISESSRKVEYSEELAEQVCGLVAAGVSLTNICAQPGMPSRMSVYNWRMRFPEFREKYEFARLHRAEARSDQIDDIVADLLAKRIDPNSARAAIDALRWQASKENAARYGDKVSAEISGKDGKDLIPAESSPRDLARAVLGILREAHTTGEPEIPIGGYQSTVQNSPQLSAASDSAVAETNHTVDAGRAPNSALAISPSNPEAETADAGGQAEGVSPPDSSDAGELEIGEREVLDNRAQIIRDPHNGRYAILDHSGAFHGYRRTRAEAHALATNIKQTPPRSTEIDEEFGRYV